MFRPRVIVLLLILTTMLAYLPALQNDFLGFDDETYVTENTKIQDGVTWVGVKWAFTTFHASNWHPLTWFSYMVDFKLFRLNPAGHHFINILFHSANAGLLLVLLFRLTGNLWPSAFVAALFAWHPLHVESVAWIAELKDVLSTFWGLLAMLAYVRYAKSVTCDTCLAIGDDESGNATSSVTHHPLFFYWLSLVLFALSLMSKSMLVTLPFVLLLLDYWPLQRTTDFKRCLVEKIPFLLLAAGTSLLTIEAQRDTAMASLSAVAFPLRLENAVASYAGYLWKAAWPVDLAILYPLPDQHVPAWKLAWAAITLAGISGIAVFVGRRQPWIPVGWLWYLGALVPVIGLVQVGSQAMADRYTYFPLIGIFLAATLSVAVVARRFQIPQALLAGLAGLILVACLAQTEWQLPYWRNTQTLFTRAIKLNPKNPLAYLVLGDAYQDDHQYDKALAEYKKSLELSNGQASTYQSIGRLLGTQGKPEQALEYYRIAVKLKPMSPDLHDSIGVLLIELNRFKEAGQEFAEAIRLDPAYAPAHFRMGWIFLRQDKGRKALDEFREALRLEPNNLEKLIYVARVMSASQNPQARSGVEACRLAQQAVALAGTNQPSVLDTLAAAYAEAGRFEEAAKTQRQAINLAATLGSHDDESAMRQRLELYLKGQPWRKSYADDYGKN